MLAVATTQTLLQPVGSVSNVDESKWCQIQFGIFLKTVSKNRIREGICFESDLFAV